MRRDPGEEEKKRILKKKSSSSFLFPSRLTLAAWKSSITSLLPRDREKPNSIAPSPGLGRFWVKERVLFKKEKKGHVRGKKEMRAQGPTSRRRKKRSNPMRERKKKRKKDFSLPDSISDLPSLSPPPIPRTWSPFPSPTAAPKGRKASSRRRAATERAPRLDYLSSSSSSSSLTSMMMPSSPEQTSPKSPPQAPARRSPTLAGIPAGSACSNLRVWRRCWCGGRGRGACGRGASRSTSASASALRRCCGPRRSPLLLLRRRSP